MENVHFCSPVREHRLSGWGRILSIPMTLAKKRFTEAMRLWATPSASFVSEGPADQLQLTEHTQLAILTAVIAAELLRAEGIGA